MYSFVSFSFSLSLKHFYRISHHVSHSKQPLSFSNIANKHHKIEAHLNQLRQQKNHRLDRAAPQRAHRVRHHPRIGRQRRVQPAASRCTAWWAPSATARPVRVRDSNRRRARVASAARQSWRARRPAAAPRRARTRGRLAHRATPEFAQTDPTLKVESHLSNSFCLQK